MFNYIIHEVYRLVTENELAVVIIIIIGFVSALYSFLPKSNQDRETTTNNLNVNDSPGSINTINQIGDNYTNTKQSYILEKRFVSQSMNNEFYITNFVITIAYPVEKLKLSDYPDNVVSYNLIPQSAGQKNTTNGPIPYKSFMVTFKSKSKLNPSEFTFTI